MSIIDDESRQRSPEVSAEEYGAFIGQVELRNIWLALGEIRNLHGPVAPECVHLDITDSATFEPISDGFICQHAYQVAARADGSEAFRLGLELNVQFHSSLPMTEQLFAIFSVANLPLNTWPYLREFVASSTGRMGWQPLTLPALKRGVPASPPDRASESTRPSQKSPKARRKSASTKMPAGDA